MSDITIKKVDSKNLLKDFIKFQWEIYKGNEFWVPPLISERKNLLNKNKNPFFKHGDADYFLAYKNEKIVGRIAAIKNDLHNKIHNDKVGFFGFFECINEQEVANKLFDTAKDWLIQNGLTSMCGPANPSSNDEYGLLIDGFDDSPRLLMPYNPPYYIELIENYNLKKVKDLFAYKIENEKMIASEKLKRGVELIQKRYNINIRQINLKKFNEELDNFKYIYNKAWELNWGFVPLTDDEINAMAKDLKPIVEPSFVIFGEKEGKLIGAALVMLDYNQIFKELNGHLFPFGFIKLYTKKKEIKWARILTLGLLPEYRNKGIDSLFYWEILQRGTKLGIKLGEASWVLEDNIMMNRGLELMNAHVYKKYRIYEMPIS
ncbi:MAG: GNAT family N-acetyltransferase [Ignavibacterium sp.]